MKQHRRMIDGSKALVHPRLPEEPLLAKGYVHDLEKYVKEHKRLYTMDHFSPYGPWSTDFADWDRFLESLHKSSRGTTSMATSVYQDRSGALTIETSGRWPLRTKPGDRIVISRTHPTMDEVATCVVEKVGRRKEWFSAEWKQQWGPFSEFSDKTQPADKR